MFGYKGKNGRASGMELDSATNGNVGDPTVVVKGIIGDDRGNAPANLVKLAFNPKNWDATSHMATYTTPSGGIVFSSGSLNFVGSLGTTEDCYC